MTASRAAYLVRGPEPALVEQLAHDLVHRLAGPVDPHLCVEDYDADDAEPGAIVNACLTPALLVDRRVVVVRHAGRLGSSDIDALVGYLEQARTPAPSESSPTLVLVAGGGALAPRLVAAVKAVGELVEAPAQTVRARTQWVQARLRAGPVHLDARASARLAEHAGEDLWRLSGVLGALAAAYGEGARLGVDDVEPFLGSAGGVAPWELTDAIDRGETAAALAVLQRMLGAGGRHPLVVMATLHHHYASMLRLDGAPAATPEEAAALLGIRSDFVAGKALAGARRLGASRLARGLRLLADADLDLRGARAWPPALVLEVLVARLSRLSGHRPAGRRPRNA